MGRFFSDAVETALRDLYYQMVVAHGEMVYQHAFWNRLRTRGTGMRPACWPAVCAAVSMSGTATVFRRMDGVQRGCFINPWSREALWAC